MARLRVMAIVDVPNTSIWGLETITKSGFALACKYLNIWQTLLLVSGDNCFVLCTSASCFHAI